jgi:hypothetical protein
MAVANATYKESYLLGTADSSTAYSVLAEVREDFKANEYSLVGQNCNHFSEAFAFRLLGKRPPSFVNRLARAGTWVNFLLP